MISEMAVDIQLQWIANMETINESFKKCESMEDVKSNIVLVEDFIKNCAIVVSDYDKKSNEDRHS